MENGNEHRISAVEQRVSQLETEVQVIRVSYVQNDVVGDLRANMNARFSDVDQRFSEVDQRLAVVETEVRLLRVAVEKLEEKMDKLQAEVADLKAFFFRAMMLNNIAMFGIFIAVFKFVH